MKTYYFRLRALGEPRVFVGSYLNSSFSSLVVSISVSLSPFLALDRRQIKKRSSATTIIIPIRTQR